MDTTTAPEHTRHGIGFTGWFVIIVGIVAFLAYIGQPSQEQLTKERAVGTPEDASTMCQQYVKQRLRAPATASFPSMTGRVIEPGLYKVASYVDAQNGFSALIRTPFTCEIKKIPGGDLWQLQQLAME